MNSEVARLYVNSVYNFKGLSLLDAQRQFFDFLHTGNSGVANLLEDMRFLMRLFASKYFFDNFNLPSALLEKLEHISHQVSQTLQILVEEKVILDKPVDKYLMLRIYPHFNIQEVSDYMFVTKKKLFVQSNQSDLNIQWTCYWTLLTSPTCSLLTPFAWYLQQ